MRASLFLVLVATTLPTFSTAQNLESTPIAAPPASLQPAVTTSFWRAENVLQQRLRDGEERGVVYSPLVIDDPLRAEYSRAASAADAFIKLSDESKNEVLPEVLYLGGLSKYSLADNAGALSLFARLNQNFPSYERGRYSKGRDTRFSIQSAPLQASLSKLIFYLRLQVALEDTPDAFASIQQITNDALSTLSYQRAYASWVASFSDQYNRRQFDESRFGSEPDQRRASVLPPTLSLVEEAWDKLMEKALAKAGAKAMRDWLRGLSTPGAPLSKVAQRHLNRIETTLASQFKQEVEAALAAKDYDKARIALRQLREVFGENTQIAQFVETKLDAVTQGYKEQGDATFNTDNGRPQTEANEIYKKMVEAAEDPATKGYALFRLAQTVGTMGKYQEGIDYLDQAIAIWHAMPPEKRPPFTESVRKARRVTGPEPDYYIEDASYYRAFYIAFGLKHDDEGVRLLNEFVEKFPDSLYVAECLWNIVLIYRWSGRRKEAAEACRVLVARRPDGVRAENARDMLVTDYKKY